MKFIRNINTLFNENDLCNAILLKTNTPKPFYKINLRNNYAYLCIGHKHFTLHRLLAEYYYGEIKKGMSVHHKNKNKLDNSMDNLIIVNKSEHAIYHKDDLKHKTDEGMAKSQRCATNSITRKDITHVQIVELRNIGMTYSQISKSLKCSHGTIRRRLDGNPKTLDWSVEE